MSKDIILTVDYHDRACVVRRLDRATSRVAQCRVSPESSTRPWMQWRGGYGSGIRLLFDAVANEEISAASHSRLAANRTQPGLPGPQQCSFGDLAELPNS